MISRIFLHHPRSVNETYLQHMAFASWFAAKLLMAASAALIHALIPCIFEKTASSIIVELYERLQFRDDGSVASEPASERIGMTAPPQPNTPR